MDLAEYLDRLEQMGKSSQAAGNIGPAGLVVLSDSQYGPGIGRRAIVDVDKELESVYSEASKRGWLMSDLSQLIKKREKLSDVRVVE